MEAHRGYIRSDGKIFTCSYDAGSSISHKYKEKTGYAWQALSKCINGKQKTVGGYKWQTILIETKTGKPIM